MLGLVVLGVLVLAPSVSTYVEQRQKIAALQESVQVTKEEVAELERERDRWNDPTYIMTQARERLYYTNPNEVSFLIVDDLEQTDVAREPEPVSAEVEEKQADWMGGMLRSLVAAGTAKSAVEVTVGIPDEPEPGETPTP
ncbi:septum formation initiator family protein [Microbacterium marinilacus]|nr:septum formation initiator family protein [Microbacterium marinilacus]